jgi:hypothetical protein
MSSCGSSWETIQNVIVSCQKLAKSNYKQRHNHIAKIFQQRLVKYLHHLKEAIRVIRRPRKLLPTLPRSYPIKGQDYLLPKINPHQDRLLIP